MSIILPISRSLLTSSQCKIYLNYGFGGSSDIRWGSWGESAGGEEHAEAVVVLVAVAAGEAA
ncbi:hypothetical protein, partial [Brevibacterium otitidis]|uniref:hypothetical protein n=1 Tax=Brevibacterium otitidis TaxID=53364 RepID=UPI00366B7EBB